MGSTGQDFVEREIAGERAGALARAVDALEMALAAFLDHDGGGKLRQHLLEEAAERLWFVVVQREAMGISRHEVLYEVLRVPKEVRRVMGPAPRRAMGPAPHGRAVTRPR